MGINHAKQNKKKLKNLKENLSIGFFCGVPIILFLCFLVFAFHFLSIAVAEMKDERVKAESMRYNVVSKELNVSRKHLLVEKRAFSDLYEVIANGDHYLVEFNDDYTKLKRLVKDSK
ncbi:hypothetical protein MH050_03420 [Bacillus licheniformis]|uniref:hypothetical protein n=1 Tax=Bacillus TaxID=1386 RepID=UPI0011A9AA1C|nr:MULTISPECIES: hypothetical protein [Bacillus subtilis group]MCA1181415.1 hypothetical protein [Bacillus licheniformis]MCM3210457.1 hypothetical protein [Bacillus licheniformis]MCM3286063.1 hypothetical protein [Bacillus licheniformis]MCY7739897.1 hypothetical protein [Bacillus licheniformis]MEC2101946.1 hypothetical protein [Bacillus licheniformis]